MSAKVGSCAIVTFRSRSTSLESFTLVSYFELRAHTRRADSKLQAHVGGVLHSVVFLYLCFGGNKFVSGLGKKRFPRRDKCNCSVFGFGGLWVVARKLFLFFFWKQRRYCTGVSIVGIV